MEFNRIRSLNVTTSYRIYWGQRNIFIPQGCRQQNPECEKPNKANDPIPSKKLQKKLQRK